MLLSLNTFTCAISKIRSAFMCIVYDEKFIVASSQDYQHDYRFSFSHQDINQGWYEVLLCWIDLSCNYGSLWIYLVSYFSCLIIHLVLSKDTNSNRFKKRSKHTHLDKCNNCYIPKHLTIVVLIVMRNERMLKSSTKLEFLLAARTPQRRTVRWCMPGLVIHKARRFLTILSSYILSFLNKQ